MSLVNGNGNNGARWITLIATVITIVIGLITFFTAFEQRIARNETLINQMDERRIQDRVTTLESLVTNQEKLIEINGNTSTRIALVERDVIEIHRALDKIIGILEKRGEDEESLP